MTAIVLSEEGTAVQRSIAVSAVTQLVAKVGHLGLNIVTSVALIRHLGPDRYGDYVVVITVTGLVGLVSDFGLTKLAVREVSRDPDSLARVIGTTLAIRVALSFVAATLSQILLLAIGVSGEVHTATAIASLFFIVDSLLIAFVVFHVALRQQYEAFVRVAMEVVEAAVLFWLIRQDASLVLLVTAPLAGGVAGIVLAWLIARRVFAARATYDRRLVRGLVAAALPIGPAIAIGVLAVKLDGFAVASLRSRREAGIYGAAFQPIEYAFLAITVVAYPFFPLLSRWHRTDTRRFEATYQQGTEAVLGFVMPIATVVVLTAPDVVNDVYRPEWIDASVPLRILAAALVFMSFAAWQGFVLLAADHQRATLRYGAAALLTNAVLCVILVPILGFRGGALAATAASGLAAVWSASRVRQLVGLAVDRRRLARLLLANALFAATLTVAQRAGLPWWAAVAVAVAGYPAWLNACGVLRLAAVRQVLGTSVQEEATA